MWLNEPFWDSLEGNTTSWMDFLGTGWVDFLVGHSTSPSVRVSRAVSAGQSRQSQGTRAA